MRNLLFFLFVVLSNGCFSQKFTPDSLGHIADPAFKTFLKSKGVQLCGTFFPVKERRFYGRHFAAIVNGGKAMYMDLNGTFYPTLDEVMEKLWENEEGDVAEYVMDREEGFFYNHNTTGVFLENGKRGFKYNGKVILPAIYSEIDFTLVDDQPFITMKLNGKNGIVDTNGIIVLQPEYEGVFPTENSGRLAYIAKKDGLYAVFDREGKVVLPFQSYRLTIQDGMIFTSTTFDERKGYGLMNSKGEIVMTQNPDYRVLSPMTANFRNRNNHYLKHLILILSGKPEDPNYPEGLMDTNGKILLKPVYKNIDLFTDSILLVTLEITNENKSVYGSRRVGFYDLSKRTFILDPEYVIDEEYYGNGKRIIKETGNEITYGYITENGKVAVPANYKSVIPLGDYYILESATESIFADSTLKAIFPGSFQKMKPLRPDELQNLPENLLIVKTNDKYGVITTSGKVIVPSVYKELEVDYSGIIAKSDLNVQVLDMKGKVLMPAQKSLLSIRGGIYDAIDMTEKRMLGDFYGNKLPYRDLKWNRGGR